MSQQPQIPSLVSFCTPTNLVVQDEERTPTYWSTNENIIQEEEEKEIQIISSTTEPPPKYTANDSDCLSFAINFE